MPLRMIYHEFTNDKDYEVDVYHFATDYETLDTFVTCWVLETNYWITVPIAALSPIKTKKELLEG